MLLFSTEGVMSKPGWIIAVVVLSVSSSACLIGDIPPSTAANKDVARNYIERVINEEDWSAWPDLTSGAPC